MTIQELAALARMQSHDAAMAIIRGDNVNAAVALLELVERIAEALEQLAPAAKSDPPPRPLAGQLDCYEVLGMIAAERA